MQQIRESYHKFIDHGKKSEKIRILTEDVDMIEGTSNDVISMRIKS